MTLLVWLVINHTGYSTYNKWMLSSDNHFLFITDMGMRPIHIPNIDYEYIDELMETMKNDINRMV